MMWQRHDIDQNGVLDVYEAKKCIQEVFTKVFERDRLSPANLNKLIDQLDVDRSGTIEKTEFADFLVRMIKNEMFKAGHKQAFDENITNGRHYM